MNREYGKPRPAVVVQSDLFNPTHPSLTLCPLTSELRDVPLFRVPVSPSEGNGLRLESEVMVDKLCSQPLSKVRESIGRLEEEAMDRVDEALKLWLGLP